MKLSLLGMNIFIISHTLRIYLTVILTILEQSPSHLGRVDMRSCFNPTSIDIRSTLALA